LLDITHFAAQANQIWAICYLKENFNISFTQCDIEGNTPLHWACYYGNFQAADFILKFEPSLLNIQNNSGNTALHLAVEDCLQTNSLILVRSLLFSGADRNIRNKIGQRPIDIFWQNEPKTRILRDLQNILAEQSECICLMLKLPVKKLEPTNSLVYTFCVLHFICHFLGICLYFPSIF